MDNLQKSIISQILLQQGSILEDSFQKATGELHYEWRERKKKDGSGTFQQRYKVKNSEATKEEQHSRLQPNASGKHQASLAHELSYAIPYNGNFYNHEGERIYLNDKEKKHAQQQFGSKQGLSILLPTQTELLDPEKSINENAKLRKDNIIEKIKQKDPHFEKEVERLKYNHESYNKNETLRRAKVSEALHRITETTKTLEISSLLNQIRSKLSNEINPNLKITTYNKDNKEIVVNRNLDELVNSFNELSNKNQYSRPSVKIKDIKIENFDDFDISDFQNRKHEMNPVIHKNIYDRINKHLEKQSKLKENKDKK